jgi:hypothetical protein
MSTYDSGVLTPFDYSSSIKKPVFGVALHSFVNRTPLFTRLQQAPLGAMSFVLSTTLYRPSTLTFNNGGTIGASATSFTVVDGSYVQIGDVLEAGSEMYLVTAVAGNVLTVTSAYAGTTTATHADAGTVYIVGNTRTGGEVNVPGISRVPVAVTQYAQTFQHPYQVGGALASATEFALPPGVVSVVGRERWMCMQNCADDIERAFYYGKAVPLASASTRQQMAGLRSLIQTNNTVNPTNYTSYSPADLTRDLIQPVFAAGGNPDLLLVGTDWIYGFQLWNQALIRYSAGETMTGLSIDTFEAPFLTGISIIPCPLMRPGQAFVLSSAEVRQRVKRPMFDKPRGSTGDADQGDIIAELAIELDNENHHAMIQGITGWAALT